jgi:hypothetical protein
MRLGSFQYTVSAFAAHVLVYSQQPIPALCNAAQLLLLGTAAVLLFSGCSENCLSHMCACAPPVLVNSQHPVLAACNAAQLLCFSIAGSHRLLEDDMPA